MDLVKGSIARPVTVSVCVLLVVMFGMIGVNAIPIQLTPNVDRPIVTVETRWAGRSPEEIVERITQEQEEQLKNVNNLRKMVSVSNEGQSSISLEFMVGADIGRALQEVSDALRQVPEYPADVDEPTVRATEGSTENAIAWIIIELPAELADEHPGFEISHLFDQFEKEVKPFLERIDGVARVNIYGGRPRETRVLADARRLARHGLTYRDLVQALRSENLNISAGAIAEGKRDYRIRVVGQFETEEDVLETIIAYRNGAPIYVRDVAEVEIGYTKERGFVRSHEGACMAMNLNRQNDANVMVVMEELRERLDEVRTDILPTMHPTAGPHLVMRQVYDETVYISSAISLVTQNLWIGGLIAAGVLLLFLRSFISTGVVALAIPISVVGTFLALLAMGRTLNVVSLAGLAFAVGMVVDNAIVVLENIDRRLSLGDGPMQAAYRGAREVWGAVLASTLTTVAVFVPILTIREEAGQLFGDISLAIVAAVALSLLVSVTVIPAACSRWLHAGMLAGHHGLRRAWDNLFGVAPVFGKLADGVRCLIFWLITGWRAWSLRPLLIVALTAASLFGAAKLIPPLDYLPAGNRNLVFGGLLIPPGYSVDHMREISKRVESKLMPYYEAQSKIRGTTEGLAPITRFDGDPYEPVAVKNFFIGSFSGGMFLGGRSEDPTRVIPVGQLITNAMLDIPDSYGGASQTNLFGRGISGGNTVDLEISGPSLERVNTVASAMFQSAAAIYGFGKVRTNPANFNLPQQEWKVRLTETGRELGVRPETLGVAARAFFDGAFVGDFHLEGDTIDLVVLPEQGKLGYKEQLESMPIVTPSGRVVPFDTVATIERGLAPQSIQRIEELPSVTISVTPPVGAAIETVMSDLQGKVIGPVEAAGLIDRSMRVRLEGTAAKLDEVKSALIGDASAIRPSRSMEVFLQASGAVILFGGIAVGILALVRFARRRDPRFIYGMLGAVLVGGILATVLSSLSVMPELATGRLVWALVVTYLLMAALFESFVYPLVIMFTVPLAIVGGFAGLRIVHDITMQNPYLQPQQLDVLTMLGFVILIGVVVNNAILLVHQALNFMRSNEFGDEPMPMMEAVAEAVRTRIRPIFMSTMTSVGGMTPLVLFPGAGSELYRGLGSVVIGGLLVATIFTLLLAPMLLSLVLQMTEGLRMVFRRTGDPTNTPAKRPGADAFEPAAAPAMPDARELEPV